VVGAGSSAPLLAEDLYVDGAEPPKTTTDTR
jgi:hypothetical protein